jgi:alkylation response protein AidB-like acyl-CoA dehydrogenase
MIFDEEVACYDVPAQVATIGLAMIGPTLIAHGTDDHKARYLPRMLRGDDIWCQLWSEPGAGSDLASLATRAELDGDGYVLNGQKVWTSGAHYSDLGLGIFRSDADAPKHRGISCLIVDMRTPGITVRPLRQMTGGANFNEVFFDDVRVPAANLVGARHDGWRVALTVLMNERFASGGLSRASQVFPLLAALARTTGGGDVDAVCRQRLAEVYSLGRIFELTNARVRSALASGALPGPEGSILKLAVAELGTRQAAAALAVLGGSGMLSGNDSPEGGRWQSAFLAAPAVHIGGGTDEVQRNIIGEKVLGLPKEPAA